MKTIINRNATAAEQPCRTKTTTVPTLPKAKRDWQPEPCGLSREELRKIVADQLG
ncbi:hypothetical protein J8I29_25770 [Labrys sp. LIt4]|uniref:hypothetical protein n=1 Tax=Labrys TaxID=204476 RepID=UPI0015E49132|nr:MULTISPECIES: hypothetical protein [Labrys]MBP0582760.1 hypothetical protein [Labrys sp. LIt4]